MLTQEDGELSMDGAWKSTRGWSVVTTPTSHGSLSTQWVDPHFSAGALVVVSVSQDVGNKQLLEGLIAVDPERYGPQHKRTQQLRIRDWRIASVQE